MYWNDEELADDDEIVNVIVIDGPVTRDGDGCSYGSKDHRDQILYANTIPQVVGHIFIINTPGGAASARIDYKQAIADCRECGKPTVAWIDGMCCSAGQLVASLCDRTIVMNGRDTVGCIGTMCAFWAVPHNTVDQDGYRYIELVSVTSPDKNAEYREAADGKTEKLQAELDRLGEEFRETVRQNRPLVKEEHLTGKTFDADEVMGALVDEVGDYGRAIECVFELAGKTLTAARLVTAEPTEEPDEEPDEDPATESQGTVAEAQGTGAESQGTGAESQGTVATEAKGTVATEGSGEAQGTETVVVVTQFGTEAFEVEKKENQKDNDMKEEEEEKKAAEVAEQPATTQEEQAPATEQATEEAPATEAPAVEEKSAEEQPSEETIENAQEEIDRIAETLHNAEALVEQRNKEIAELKEQLATLEGIAEERDKTAEELATALTLSTAKETTIAAKDEAIAERDKTIAEHVATIAAKDATITEKDASIEALKKKVADLQAEVKELSEKPAPMTDAASGVPADNGTGEAPKSQQRRIKAGMSYEEIRKAMRQ